MFTLITILSSWIYTHHWEDLYTANNPKLEAHVVIDGRIVGEKPLLEPVSVQVTKDGRILILDAAENQIRVFHEGGKESAPIGRRGEGPGEFLAALQMAVSPNGRILVYDFMKRRFVWFNSNGGFIKHQPFTDFVWKLRFLPDGYLLIETRDLDFGDQKGTTVKLVRYTPSLDGEQVIDQRVIKDSIALTKPIQTRIPQPFFETLQWDVLPDGRVVTVRSETFEMKVFSGDGVLQSRTFLAGKVLPITDADKTAFIDQLQISIDFQQQAAVPEAIRKAIQWPTRKPFCSNVLTDDGGHIIALTHQIKEASRLASVYDTHGKFLTDLRIPAGSRTFFSRGRLFIIRNDPEADHPLVIEARPATTPTHRQEDEL